MSNNFLLEFYKKNKISPVKQNISNINNHLKRRSNLYNILGIPMSFLKKSKVLEIGPGSGHNALALLLSGVKLDLVEPNETGANEVINLFNQYNIPKENYNLYVSTIEDFNNNENYDIILAEGFLAGLNNRKNIINKLNNLLKSQGILVVTCTDEVSFLFENIRRIISHELALKYNNLSLDEKIKTLSNVFKSHFESLKYATRSLEDWVLDQFICPTFYGEMFSIENAINEFVDDFDVYNSSPQFFTNISWYKDLSFNKKENFLKSYYEKKHILMHYKLENFSIRSIDKNKNLEIEAKNLRNWFNEKSKTEKLNLKEANIFIKKILNNCDDLGNLILDPLQEIIDLFERNNLVKEINTLNKFKSSFGKSMQYLSIIKK